MLQDRLKVRNRNACNRVGTRIVRRFGVISDEDLRIRNMTAAARGMLQEPERNVRAKAGLNRDILTQIWGMARNQLRYKPEWVGREHVAVKPALMSQYCHRCGQRSNRGRSRVFRCRACGLSVDRDLNTAVNMRKAGSLALATRKFRDGESIGAERYA